MAAVAADILHSANSIGRWLTTPCVSDAAGLPTVASLHYSPEAVDLVVLCGSSVVLPTCDEAARLAARHHCPILVTGGVGHSTPLLLAECERLMPLWATSVGEHSVRRLRNILDTTILAEGAMPAEADILRVILEDVYGIASDSLIIENNSTNCGDNAQRSAALIGPLFARRVMSDESIVQPPNRPCSSSSRPPWTVGVVQDPTMQLRSVLGFTKHLRRVLVSEDPSQPADWRVVSCPVASRCITRDSATWPVGRAPTGDELATLRVLWSTSDCDDWEATTDSQRVRFLGPTLERYLSLLLGEVKRLANDASGYGPEGKDFNDVLGDVPPEVQAAAATLRGLYPSLDR